MKPNKIKFIYTTNGEPLIKYDNDVPYASYSPFTFNFPLEQPINNAGGHDLTVYNKSLLKYCSPDPCPLYVNIVEFSNKFLILN